MCPEWLSPSRRRSSHRDTDALLTLLQSKAQHQPLPTLHQGLGRVRRCLLVRTGLSESFTNTVREGVLLYHLQRWHLRSFPSGAPGLWSVSPRWVWWPSISTGSTWSLDRACWAPLLPFCLSLCREAPGIVLSPLVWSITCGGNIPLRNKGWRVTGGKCDFRRMPFPNYMRIMISPVPYLAGGSTESTADFLKQNSESV